MEKPHPTERFTFQRGYFDRLVAAWEALPEGGPTIIVEDTPWAYLTRHELNIDPATHHDCKKAMARLTLPTFHFVFHASGTAIGRRHPDLHETPEMFSPFARSMMNSLQHMEHPWTFIDASGTA